MRHHLHTGDNSTIFYRTDLVKECLHYHQQSSNPLLAIHWKQKWNHLLLPSVFYLLIIPGPTLLLSFPLPTWNTSRHIFCDRLKRTAWTFRLSEPWSFQHLNKDEDCITSGVNNQLSLSFLPFCGGEGGISLHKGRFWSECLGSLWTQLATIKGHSQETMFG